MDVLKGFKVRNMDSGCGAAKNKFIIETPTAVVFQSYNSVIAVKQNGQVYLDERYWDYSVTTVKYRNRFLHESIAETRRKIKDGIYKLANLN